MKTQTTQPTKAEIETRALKYGTESLSDSELFNLIFDSDRSDEIFSQYGGLVGIVREEENVLKYNGASEQEILKLRAMGILSERIYYAKNYKEEIQVTSPEAVYDYLAPKIRHLSHEVFYVLSLDNSKNIISVDKVSEGGKTATIVDIATVMKIAILNDACSIILCHNHPSENCHASHADKQLTKRIVEVGKLHGIPVNDHVIIAGYNFLSMRNEGML